MHILDKDLAIQILEKSLISKYGDLREELLVRQGAAKDHVSKRGHEAHIVPAMLLEQQDYIFPYYRGTHLALGKGASRYEVACDFFANEHSSSGGHCPVAHFSSRELNIFPSIAPVASQCLPAVGVAWAMQLLQQPGIVLCSIGDGATREGEFFEAVAFAIQEALPIIFLIEDNGYAISTKTHRHNPFNMDFFPENRLVKMDGHNILDVYTISKNCIARVRNGDGPILLWSTIDRLHAHTALDNQSNYRDENELNQLIDPISNFEQSLADMGIITQVEINDLHATIQHAIKAEYQRASQQPPNTPTINNPPTQSVISRQTTATTTMADALNEALTLLLAANSKTILLGQDIADPKGGVFGLTRNLSTNFPSQVINTPIAEATMLGAAMGLASHHFKPIVELQFIDFMTPAFDQLANQLTTLYWRTKGKWQAPVIIYTPYGAYLPGGGPWHSQSNEAWWTHIPNLIVMVPSTPLDVVQCFAKASYQVESSLILIPKHLMFTNMTQYDDNYILQEGSSITVVCWGNLTEHCQMAAKQLKDENIEVELVKLVQLTPMDLNEISASVQKTNRLLVVQEDNNCSSYGSTIISTLIQDPSVFNNLLCPPQLLGRNNQHIPFQTSLEAHVLPQSQDIVATIRNMCYDL